ncbi:MAG: hypothetical protein ACRECH_18760, partial [Nitrososphaerales archaeon]
LGNMQTAMSFVSGSGKPFVNYYVSPSMIPNGGYLIGHTNFPGGAGSYAQVYTLDFFTSSLYLGIDSGFYGDFQFPSTVTCPIGSSSIDKGTSGWNQCVVNTEISTALAQPSQFRQFVNFVAGFAGPQFSTFTDTAGIKTSQLWDNPTLRSWIWNDPQYQSNFVLSTSNAQPPGPQPPPKPPPSGGGSGTCNTSTSSPKVGSWVKVTCSGLPPSSKLRLTITNSNGNKIVAILFPGSTGSTGHSSFVFQIRSSMIGSNSISIYSHVSSNTLLISGLQFTVP